MKQYTIGKKAAVIVLHQLCMILMVTGVFATGYAFRHDAHGNIDIYTLISLAGLVGSFVSLAYMANVAGRKSEDDYTIYYLPIDKVYSDVMLVIFTLLMVFMGKVISGVKNQHFDYASLIMTAGTFTFLFDMAFIILYQSIVRKIKGNILCTHSLMYKGYELLKRVIEKKDIHTQKTKEIMRIQEALEAISEGALDTTLNVNEFHGQQKKVAEAVNHIRQGLMSSVNESLKNEKLKADLITNVSHDIKTPLTSIVNYVDLLKRENLENENAKYYIHVLEEKSQRLKQLTEDLVETSKITSGNVKLNMQKLDLVELLYQTGGEFNERFESRNLTKFIYNISLRYIDDPCWFVNRKYVTSNFVNAFEEQVYAAMRKNPIIQHHHANHPGIYAPAWKTIEFMTIGNIITLYDSLKETDAKDLVANAYGCSRGVFYNYMETIRVLRNKCAHGGCIYRMDFPRGIKRLPADISADCRHNIKGGIDVVRYILGCISQTRKTELENEIHNLVCSIQTDEAKKVVAQTSKLEC
mgnify:CR=1 FL=1